VKLTIYLADDHAMFANALALTIEGFKDVSKVKTASNGKELIDLVEKKKPDVVITDFEMPVMDGMEVIKRISKKYPEVKIILLTMYNNVQLVREAMDHGVHAFLTKSFDPSELETAIISVVEKDFYHNDLMYKALKYSASVNIKTSTSLTDREKEVLHLICDELTMKEIGDKLFVSDKTIQNHRQALLRKLGAKNTAGLVKKAIEEGIYKIS